MSLGVCPAAPRVLALAGLVILGVDDFQSHLTPVDQYLAGVFEVDGDAVPDGRLYLSQTPIRLLGVANDRTRHQFHFSYNLSFRPFLAVSL